MSNCCFGNDKIVCGVLNVNKCNGESCSFRMTQAQLQLAQSACDERLRELPADRQDYIADKYYSGRRAWNRPRGQTF